MKFGSGFAVAALRQPEAFAVHLEDMDMTCEAVEDRAGEAFGAEDLSPFIDGRVRVCGVKSPALPV